MSASATMSTTRANRTQLRAAYAICRGIARSAAKNFYYGFLVLPRHKRNALSAVYAFMRQCDDIVDDMTPGCTVDEKRAKLAAWQELMHAVVAGQPTDDPVLMALADTQLRYGIPLNLLDKLVAGTAMDLNESLPPIQVPRPLNPPPPVVLYSSFDELYRYCYHVASVVGLTTIKIFGYKDAAAAEKYAEETGVAFQLTNIIRDVAEDAAIGRIYLPGEDLARFGISPTELVHGDDRDRLRPLLALQAERARELYRSAERLLPLVEEDSRPALWALVEIYRRLLERIVANNYDVFSGRVRLSTAEKSFVLARGLWQRLI